MFYSVSYQSLSAILLPQLSRESKIMDTKFIVWVGGVPDYEGNSLRDAKAVYKEWIDLDYDDVILEEITE